MSRASRDLLVMYPPVGSPRLARLLSLPADATLTVALDSAEAVRDLADAARRERRAVGVLVELDVGLGRTGVRSAEEVVALARAVREAGQPLEFAGIAFYPGHVREPVAEQGAKLRGVARQLEEVLAALDRARLPARVISGGSTPAAWRMHELPGVTEVRPGTYVFNDRTTAELGACAWDDCALTVLTTVVSTAVPGQAVVDAGTKALGREPLRGAADEGFGALLDDPRVTVRAMSEEHGILDLRDSAWRPRVGERVRIVPNHVCIVVHLNDVLVAMNGAEVAGTISVEARGRHTDSLPAALTSASVQSDEANRR